MFKFRGMATVIMAALLLTACAAPHPASPSSTTPTDSKPVKITILDAAGDLQVSKPIIETFKKSHPELIAEIEYQVATAPELTSKIKAQQMAGKVDITAVIVGPDGAAAGMKENVWMKIPDYETNFPSDRYMPIAKEFSATFGKEFGVLVNLYPSGQFFLYNPDKVNTEPRAWTLDELLAWAKANPGKLMYARPANSGPGRQFLQHLPYVLGDKDPRDPVNGWEKTWAYLKELDKSIDYYPTGTGATLKEFAEGTRWIIAATMGWDMSARALGSVPKNSQVFWIKDFPYVAGGNFWLVPNGVNPAQQKAVIELMKYMLSPEAQAEQFRNGYNYPGPAIKGVTLDMATKEVQDSVRPYLRPFYDDLLTKHKMVLNVGVEEMVKAFDTWDQQVGAKTKK